MIEKNLARDLVPLVNGLDYFELHKYVQYRIDQLHKESENSVDIVAIYHIQGAIRELRRFLNLKEEVLADSRDTKAKTTGY